MEKKKKNDKLAKADNGQKVVLRADFGDIYVRVKGNKILKPIKANMTLFERMGHLYKMRKSDDNLPITYEGYKYLNQVASINILSPQSVIVDGREQPNPHIERNDSNMVESVWIRKIGLGFSPAGILTAIDKTLFYNIYTYFIQSIQSKMKMVEWKSGKPTEKKRYPNAAELGVKDEKPEKDGRWLFLATAPPLGIWINFEDPAIVECINEHTQRQKFADRIAQTILERNIYKDHPAIGISKVVPTKKATEGHNEATVTIYGYRHEFEYPDIQGLLAQAEEGSDVVEVKSEIVEEVPYEEEAEAMKETEEADVNGKTSKGKSPAEMEEPPDDVELEGQGELLSKDKGK